MTPLRTRVSYGAGGAVSAVKEAAYTMFILLFYTQVLGLSGTVTGLIIAVSLVWDGISDPLVGSLSDRLRSRHGRRHPFMALSILPLGLGFVGLFAPPQAIVDNSAWLAGWLLFWSLWVRTFVTTFAIPHLALSAEITRDYHERSQVLGARMGFMFL
ncbi:MAG TPA: sugar transporter, partial [Halieaceae bacterium]|nr:sugar transporter [Halieaceae bacterium]